MSSKLSQKLQDYLEEIEEPEVKSVILASRDCINEASAERYAQHYLTKQRQYNEAKRVIGELRTAVQSMGVRG